MKSYKSWILGLGRDKELHLLGFPRIFALMVTWSFSCGHQTKRGAPKASETT